MISYAEVAISIPYEDETLTYEIPDELKNLQIGMRVEVPLNKKTEEGVVIEIHQMEPNYKTRKIIKQIDKTPIISEEQMKLAKWMKEYYLAPLGECLYKMVPSGRRKRELKPVNIEVESKLLTLNEEQEIAYHNIIKDLGKESVHLLYGITGSGKTEVYIHLMNELLTKTDKSAIFLVPEISLTVQILKRLEIIFGNKLAMLHSAMKVSEKFNSYLQIKRGEKRIVVGTRSAIFAPVKNLGLIIMDEEHDHSYKEHSNPRYHARQVAIQRCKENQSVLVLGSATPSLEVYYNAIQKKINLNVLKHRAKNANLPTVTVFHKKEDNEIVGSDLLFQIKKRIERKEQVVLLLNRRGHSPLIYSMAEKKFIECPNCSSNLCFHSKGKLKAVCHLCGYNESYLKLEERYNHELQLQGSGTQKLEEYLLEKFPGVRLERLDQDSTKDREVVSDVIGKLINDELDILTGTQMIAKGLDASKVTLVGVINANSGLGVPDFRASERVFSLLTQVAGRAGRSELKGEVIIETSNESHPVIHLAAKQNYEQFFYSEIKIRRDLYFPPFSRVIKLLTRSKNEEKSKKQIELIGNKLREIITAKDFPDTAILGPAECPFYRIEQNFRNQIIIKTNQPGKIKEIIKKNIQPMKLGTGIYLEIDIDPVDLV